MTREKNSPRRLWNYLGDLVAKKRRVTSSSIPSMRGRTPHETVLGWTPDISTLIQFEWYQWIYYRDNNDEQKLARWLTPADKHGGGDTYLIAWKDRSSSWVKLNDLKESFPVQLVEYAVGNKISEEPAFA